jgi:hypothetical protein
MTPNHGILVALSLLSWCCAPLHHAPASVRSKLDDCRQELQLTIVQDGVEHQPDANGVVSIARRPFTFVAQAPNDRAVLVLVRETPESMLAARRGGAIESVPGFANTPLAIYPQNRERTLTVADYAPNVWLDHDGVCNLDAPAERTRCGPRYRVTVERLHRASDTGASTQVGLTDPSVRSLYLLLTDATWERPGQLFPSGETYRVGVALRLR